MPGNQQVSRPDLYVGVGPLPLLSNLCCASPLCQARTSLVGEACTCRSFRLTTRLRPLYYQPRRAI